MHSVMLDVTGSEFHPASSRPGSWLFLRRGVSYWTSDKLGQKIYLIGNPFVWILASLSLVAYLGLNFILAVLKQRRIVVKESGIVF